MIQVQQLKPELIFHQESWGEAQTRTLQYSDASPQTQKSSNPEALNELINGNLENS